MPSSTSHDVNKQIDVIPKVKPLEEAVDTYFGQDQGNANYMSSRELLELLFNLTGLGFDEGELIQLLRKRGFKPMVTDTLVLWPVEINA